MRRQSFLLPFALAAFCLLSGCASSYHFKVDAISNPEISGMGDSYAIVHRDPKFDKSDPTYQQVEQCVKTALSGHGMYEASNVEDADVLIDISYGVSGPKTEFKTFTEMAQVQPDQVYTVYENVIVIDPETGRPKVIQVPRKVVVPGEMEPVDRVVPVISYEKYIRITAHDNRDREKNERPVQAWSVYVKNEDESDDLEKYVPLMTAAALDYMGQNSEDEENVTVTEEDEDVVFVKNGM